MKLTEAGAERLGHWHSSGGFVDWALLEPRVIEGHGHIWMNDDGKAEVGSYGDGNLRLHACAGVTNRCRFCNEWILRIGALDPAAAPLIVDTEPDPWGTVVLNGDGLGIEDETRTVAGESYRLHDCRRYRFSRSSFRARHGHR